jgi:hypothetical protein
VIFASGPRISRLFLNQIYALVGSSMFSLVFVMGTGSWVLRISCRPHMSIDELMLFLKKLEEVGMLFIMYLVILSSGVRLANFLLRPMAAIEIRVLAGRQPASQRVQLGGPISLVPYRIFARELAIK